ncbi:MAG TPA: hypothetical protein PLB01_07375 [Thermoanaerobaculia bacterium]|nr:hypothetical protein [Thermoanaerobaculia bacterium]
MKKSCALSLLVWLACTGVYGWLAWTKTREMVPAAVVGFLGGTFAAMLVGSVAGLVTGGTDREALKRAVAGEPPKDGRLEAASGRVRPLGAPLEAPFTGRACVAYEYDVKNPSAERSDFAGVALAPCAIDSPRGPVRILGWSMLDEFPKALQEEIDPARGLAYLRSTTFEPLGLVNALSFFKNLVTDQDGSIRKDMRIADSEPDLEGKRIEEKVVPVGSTVTVLGIWSEAERGIAPGSSAMLNRLYPVSPSSVLLDLRGSALKTFGIALVFFIALHAILVPMWFLAPAR